MNFNIKKALLTGTAIVAVSTFVAAGAQAQTAVTANTTFDDGTNGTDVATLTTTDAPIITINNAEVIIDADITATGANNGVVGFITAGPSVLTVNSGSTLTSAGNGDVVTTADLTGITVNVSGALTASANTQDAINFGILGAGNAGTININGGTGTNGNVTGLITGGAGADAVTIDLSAGDSTIDGAVNLGLGADTITVTGTNIVNFTSTVDAETLTLNGTGTVDLDGALTGTLNIAADGTIDLAAGISGAVDNTSGTDGVGTLTTSSGTFSIAGNVGATNSLKLVSNTGAATILLGGTVDATTITNSGAGEIEFDGAVASTTINATGGTLDFDAAVTATNTNVSNGATVAVGAGLLTSDVANAGTLLLDGVGGVVGNVANTGTIQTTAAATITGNVTGAGALHIDADTTIDGDVAATSADIATGQTLIVTSDDAGAGTAGTVSIDTTTLTGTGGLTLDADADGTTTFNGDIVAAAANNGVVSLGFDAAEAETFIINGNIGANMVAVEDLNVGTAGAGVVTATLNGNVYANDVVIGAGDTLTTTGSLFNVDTVDGTGIGAGSLVVGNGTSATTANVTGIIGGTALAGLKVSENATLNLDDNLTVNSATGGALNFDGTVNVSTTDGGVTIANAGAGALGIDGIIIVTGTGNALTIGNGGGAEIHLGWNDPAARLNAGRQIILNDVTVIGGGATAVGDVYTINAAGSADFDTTAGAVIDASGDVVTAVTDAKLILRASQSGTFSYATGDTITFIDNAIGSDLDAEMDAGRIVLGSGLLGLTSTANSDADTIEALVTIQNAASVFGAGSTGVGAANALVNFTGATGDLQTFRNNLLSANAAEGQVIAESLAPTVDGGFVAAGSRSANLSFQTTNSRIELARNGGSDTGMVAGEMGQGIGIWGKLFGQVANQDQRDGVAGYDADTFGVAVGVDNANLINNGLVGVSFSYAATDVESDGANMTDTDIDSYQLSLYGSKDLDQDMYVSSMIGYARNNIDQTRNNVGGVAGNTANADFDGDQYMAYAEFGRDYFMRDMKLTPKALVNYAHLEFDGFTETGSTANLSGSTDDVDILELGLGVVAAWDLNNDMGNSIVPSLTAEYRYDVIGDEVQSTSNFTGGGASFQTTGFEPAQSSFLVGAGLAYDMNDSMTVSADYGYEFKEDYDSHNLSVRAGMKF